MPQSMIVPLEWLAETAIQNFRSTRPAYRAMIRTSVERSLIAAPNLRDWRSERER
jgi:hypothetical protein